MADRHRVLRPAVQLIASTVARSSLLLNAFRRQDFKGKQLIAGCLPSELPMKNGVYGCHGILFDIDFRDQIQRDIFLGVYERHERAFLRGYIQRGWTCVDIGANVGFYTLLLAQLVGPSGQVFAVEASPTNFDRLRRNVSLNTAPHCSLTNVAITSMNGPVSFHTSPERNSGWGRIGEWAEGQKLISVNGQTFDDYAKDRDLHSIDFLKIDIEGHELSFVEGGRESLCRGLVKRLFVEYCGYSLEPQGVTLGNYVAAFEQLGFRPTLWCTAQIEAARKGQYRASGEILNLLFEHSASC